MRLALSVVLCLAVASGASAQAESRSAQLAKQLVSAMAIRQLDAIAAADPDEPGRFVAALVFPEVQLLAVSSRHRATDYIAQQISKKNFREVYVLLQDRTADNRLVVHDMGCDGLAMGESVDVFYEGTKDTRFDGKWQAQSITEAEYRAHEKAADEKYSRVLSLLLDAVTKLPVPTGP